jgi:hypothetical protein
MSHEAQLTRLPLTYGEWPASWLAHQSYKLAKGTVQNGLSSILPLSAHLPLRRLAALMSTSLAHVTGLASSDCAARSMASFSSAERGSFMDSVLRSSGAFGGLPRFSINIKIPIKIMASTLAPHNNYGYNKSRQNKTLRSVGTRLRATRTGFRLIPAW